MQGKLVVAVAHVSFEILRAAIKCLKVNYKIILLLYQGINYNKNNACIGTDCISWHILLTKSVYLFLKPLIKSNQMNL